MSTDIEVKPVMRSWNNMKNAMETWADGLWKTEPDKAQWIDEDTGLDCLIVRNHCGALCGYVGLPPSHKLHGKDYDYVEDQFDGLDVHGGLTFSDGCQPNRLESESICHSGNVASENVWWLGFDTAHAYDFLPACTESTSYRLYKSIYKDSIYRDFEYVKEEVKKLAKQLVCHPQLNLEVVK